MLLNDLIYITTVNKLDWYQSFSCFCLRVAPIPNLDESHVIFVSHFGLKNSREMFSLTTNLILSNWYLWIKVKSQMEYFLTSSLKWWVCSDSFGMNLLRYAIMPKQRCSSCLDLGKYMSLTFLGLEKSPLLIFGFPRILVQSLQKHICPCLVSRWISTSVE